MNKIVSLNVETIPRGPHAKLNKASGINFEKILSEKTNTQSPDQMPFSKTGEKLVEFASNWESKAANIDQLSNSLPKNLKPYFESQLLFHRLQIKTQLISRAGQTIVSSVRTLQQASQG